MLSINWMKMMGIEPIRQQPSWSWSLSITGDQIASSIFYGNLILKNIIKYKFIIENKLFLLLLIISSFV